MALAVRSVVTKDETPEHTAHVEVPALLLTPGWQCTRSVNHREVGAITGLLWQVSGRI